MDEAGLAALIVGSATAASAAVTVYRARSDRHNTDVQASEHVVVTAVEMAERLTNVAASLMTPLQNQLIDATKEIELLKDRLNRLEEAEEACLKREELLKAEMDELQAIVGGRRASDHANTKEDTDVRAERRRPRGA